MSLRSRFMMTKSTIGENAQTTAQEIIYKLLNQARENELSFYTENRAEYEILFDAANRGLFPEFLSITRRGLRLNKRLVHAPLSLAHH